MLSDVKSPDDRSRGSKIRINSKESKTFIFGNKYSTCDFNVLNLQVANNDILTFDRPLSTIIVPTPL